MSSTASKTPVLFEPSEVFTDEEIGERLKASPRQVRRWIAEQRFPEGGVIDLPRGRRVYGWAVNEFLAQHVLGA